MNRRAADLLIIRARSRKAAAYLDFLSALERLADQNSSSFQQLASTHPRPQDRIKAIRPRIGNTSAGQLLAERWENGTR